MSATQSEVSPASTPQPLLEALNIPEQLDGPAIGVLILAGQGPGQVSGTYVKIGEQDKMMPGSVQDHEANTWMRLIARVGGELDQTGQVGLIIPSGGNSRTGTYEKDGKIIAPTEAELMEELIESLYGVHAPQTDKKFARADIDKDNLAHNTMDNLVNSFKIIHEQKKQRRKEGLPDDPNLDNVWVVVSHFHLPRIRILASFFGIDPAHVLSAEQVLMKASMLKEKEVIARGGLQDPTGFNRQKAMQALILARLGQPVLEIHRNYFDRKRIRGEKNLDGVIDQYVDTFDLSTVEKEAEKEWIKNNLYVEEQKSAQMRMSEERRWVRGLAMEADYVLPYAQYIDDNEQLLKFLLKFNEEQLSRYGIDRGELETLRESTFDGPMNRIRARAQAEKWKETRWKWQVVKNEWQHEEYPQVVKRRFSELGIDDTLVEALSKAEVPPMV